jgi:lipoate-protein ligase A
MWSVVRRRSTAAEFHALPIPEPAVPEIWIHEITRPALVLGSTQRGDGIADVAACERARVEVVQRRSGGGAVLLVPGEVVWVDVLLPAGHEGWADDVHRPMVWLGRALSGAFEAAGFDGVRVHDGAMVSTDHSRLICFDGLGPGELTLDDAKLVGISQRRTRSAARLQCCWYTSYQPAALTSLLVDAPAPRVLRPVATVDPEVSAAVVGLLADALDAAA